MYNIIFECEVITPMFIYGADKETPELRPPSIKGVMRFWWRAINGHLSIDELRKKEAQIFGGSGDNEGKSKIIIKVKFDYDKIKKIKYKPLPHKERKSFKNNALAPFSKFNVIFYLNNEEFINLEKLINLFMLVSILGGFGRRTRRGFGSFKIINYRIINKVKEINLKKDVNEDEYLNYNYINSLLNSVNCDNKHFNIGNGIESDFGLKHFPYIKEIKKGKIIDTYEELLIKIGKSSHDNNSDYTGFAIGSKRLASPVYVSVIKKNSKYLPIVTILETFPSNLSGPDKSQNFIEEVLS